MMFKKMILFVLFILFIGSLLAKGQNKKILKKETINKGIVVAYGKFIPRPYRIRLTKDYRIYINDILYYHRKTEKKSFLTEEDKNKWEKVKILRDSIQNYYTKTFNQYGFKKARKLTLNKFKTYKMIEKFTISKDLVYMYFGGIFSMGFPLDPRTGNPDMTSYFTDVMKIKPKPKMEQHSKKKKKVLTQTEKNGITLTEYENLTMHLKENKLITFCEYSNYGNMEHNSQDALKLITIVRNYYNEKLSKKETIYQLSYLPHIGKNKYYLYSVDRNDIEKIYQILSKEVKK